MPGLPPPAADERQSLLQFIEHQQNAFVSVSYGLTDDQARSTPSVSALSIGGLIKHATNVQKGWVDRVSAAPEFPPRDERPMEEIMAEYADQHVMREDETLAHLLDKMTEQNAVTLRTLSETRTSTPLSRCRTMCRGFRRTSTTGVCAGWLCTSSRSSPGTRAMPTSFVKPSTAQRCTS